MAEGNGSNLRIRAYIENGGNYLGICAGSYYGSKQVEFDINGPLEVNEEREMKLFKGRAIGPALKGFDYFSTKGQYALPFVFNEKNPVRKGWKVNVRKAKCCVRELAITREGLILYVCSFLDMA